ncbi:MAG: pre-peptidase C-terminal domain-containing protein [Myxococcota bacterium]
MPTVGMTRSALAACCVILACSGEKDRAPSIMGHGGTSATQGGTAGVTSSGGRTAGGGRASNAGAGGITAQGGSAQGGSGDLGGAGGAGPQAECGNAVWEPGEDCDGAALNGASCESLGFTSGELVCTPQCLFDPSDCGGTENCFDGKDNDGNGLLDCDDSACESACAASCTSSQTLLDPGEVSGDSDGHAAEIEPSCKDSRGSGSEIVYRLTATKTGVLDLALATAAQGLTISVRRTCSSAASEVDCSTTDSLSLPVTSGETLYVVVDGYSSTDGGKFTLSAESHEIMCGDGVRDPGEACDDADTTSGDGCSATCEVESTEVEPNNSSAQANSFPLSGNTNYYYAQVATAGDVDWLKVQLPTTASKLRVTTRDFGDGACGLELLDSHIAIYAADGTTLIAENDDSPDADGFCADVSAESLTPGTYYIRVMASPEDPGAVFPYALQVDVH